MKIEANDKEIQEIFSSGYFQIPRFQRPYSWGREEVENFWTDIIDDETGNYFIGSMVVYQTKKPYFGIVDGQQRLTTITIALSVIRDAFLRLGEVNLSKGIHGFIEKRNNDFVNEFILNAETSFPYLQNHIQSFQDDVSKMDFNCDVGLEETSLKLAYEILSRELEKYIPNQTCVDSQLSFFGQDKSVSDLKKLRDKFLSLKLVFIQLDNEEDAYLIFETLNARGKDLKTSDLVKNLILKTIKSSNATLDGPKEAWNGLVKMFDDISESSVVDSFLLHYWISKHCYSTDKKLFSYIKKHVLEDSGNARILLQDLNFSASIYGKMLNPENSLWTREQFEVKSSLMYLNVFKVKQQSPFVLSLLSAHSKGKISSRQLKIMLIKIEYFHFIFNAITQQRSSGSIATMYSQHAINLANTDDSDQIQIIFSSISRRLAEKIPSYEEFEVKFLELSYLSNRTKSKAIIKYALCRVLGSNSNGLDVNHSNLTIEHIFPEAVIKSGMNPDIVGNIGNLILTDASTNGHKLKDKPSFEKIEILEKEKYPLVKNFIEKDSWNESQIFERSRSLARFLYNQIKL